jgi:hypothetical protein
MRKATKHQPALQVIDFIGFLTTCIVIILSKALRGTVCNLVQQGFYTKLSTKTVR